MTTLSYTVPVPGTDLNSLADPEIATALTSIKTWSGGNVDGGNIDASVPGRRLVGEAYGTLLSVAPSGTYVFSAQGTNCITPSSLSPSTAVWWHINPALYSVTGRANCSFVLKGNIAVDGTAPVSNFTFGLYPLTAVGGATAEFTYTLGAAAFTTSTFTAPAAGTIATAEGTISSLSAGAYMPGVVSSANIASNAGVQLIVQLFCGA